VPQVNIFQWHTGRGWLVLSGGGPWDSEDVVTIEAHVLGHTLSQGPLVYIWAAGDIEIADRHMDSLRDLGARTGYLLDLLTEEEDALFEQIGEAGVLVLGDGPQPDVLRDALPGVALRGMEAAFDRGATVYAVGRSAAIFGAHAFQSDHALPGLDWLHDAIVVPGYTPDQADQLRAQVWEHSASYGLGLAQGAAIALGGSGQVEVWGNAQITVSLGPRHVPGESGG